MTEPTGESLEIETPLADDGPQITALTHAAVAGDAAAAERLLPAVYKTLRSLADRLMSREPAGHTLQPTALVHEAYLRLLQNPAVEWNNRRHFYSAAATAMRRILVERARRYQRVKRGGELRRVEYNESDLWVADRAPELLALDHALTRLQEHAPREAEVVKLRYFVGLTIEETAEALDLAPSTVKLDWSYARAWLHQEIRARLSLERL